MIPAALLESGQPESGDLEQLARLIAETQPVPHGDGKR